jgi:hypothetical protein
MPATISPDSYLPPEDPPTTTLGQVILDALEKQLFCYLQEVAKLTPIPTPAIH